MFTYYEHVKSLDFVKREYVSRWSIGAFLNNADGQPVHAPIKQLENQRREKIRKN